MGGGAVVKLLQEAGKCDYKYNIKQIQNTLHWANHLLTTKEDTVTT